MIVRIQRRFQSLTEHEVRFNSQEEKPDCEPNMFQSPTEHEVRFNFAQIKRKLG